MRHGEAMLNAASDALRALTANGRETSRHMAQWLNQQNVQIDHILVSPYLRARQTLEAMREALTLTLNEEVLPELTPNGEAEWVSDYLQRLQQQGVRCVLLVSHLPLVGYLVAELCPAEAPPMFAPAEIAAVELPTEGYGRLLWQLNPAKLPR